MRYLLLLLAITITYAQATRILSYNIYERSDRADVMLTFDTPYEGKIAQHRQSGKIIIKLTNSSIESKKVKSLKSKYLKKLQLLSVGDVTQITATVPKNISLLVSKTSDAYGLRLRFVPKVATKREVTQANNLPTKPEDQLTNSYYMVISFLIVGIIVLIYLKRRINVSNANGGVIKGGSIFKSKAEKDDVTVRFQKNLDQKNRVVMLDYGTDSYLLVLGETNLLLDRFESLDSVKTETDFSSLLKNKNHELDQYMQLKDPKVDHLQAYKEKAGALHYKNS
ncbi:MAG: hypothetical protein GQ570_01240 [Helicobacteraceae bacterium]|nr:hypothetical protein [Helicobacteraceae bacterium]